MALKRQKADIPFVQGLDLKPHPFRVQAPALFEAENCSFEEPGAITKRRGFDKLAQGSGAFTTQGVANPPTLDRVFSHGKRNLAVGGNRLYEYILATDQLSQIQSNALATNFSSRDMDAAPIPPEDTGPLEAEIGQGMDYALGVGGTYEVIASQGKDGGSAQLTVQVREAITGSTVLDFSLAPVAQFRCFATGTYVGVVYQVGVVVSVIWFNTASPPTELVPVVVTGIGGANDDPVGLDVVPEDDAGTAGICFCVATTAGGWEVHHLPGGATAVTNSVTGAKFFDSAHRMQILYKHASDDTVLTGTTVLFTSTASGTHSAFRIVNYVADAGTAVFSGQFLPRRAVIIDAAPTPMTVNPEMLVLYENGDLDSKVTSRVLEVAVAADPPGGAEVRNLFGFSLSSKGFLEGDLSLVHMNSDRVRDIAGAAAASEYVPHTATQVLVAWIRAEFDTNNIHTAEAGRSYYEQAGPGYGSNHCSNVSRLATDFGNFYGHGAFRSSNITVFTPDAQKADSIATLVTTSFNQGNPVSVGGEVYMPGGTIFAGDNFQNVGFPYRPTIFSAVTNAGAGLMDLGFYVYYAVYEFTDAAGNVHRSAPSAPFNAPELVAGANEVILSVRPYYDRGSTADVVIYRTVEGGTVAFQLSIQPEVSAEDTRNGLTLTFTDVENDTTISDNVILYTTGGGQLENYPPPSGSYMEFYQNRLWALNDEDGSAWYSKEIVPGEAPGFHPFLSVQTSARTFKPNALAASDTYIAIFAPTGVALVFGEGPNDAGLGATYTQPQVLSQSPVGCSSARSVVKTTRGVMFRDIDIGVHLLPRDGRIPEFIGGPIQRLIGDTTLGGFPASAGDVAVSNVQMQNREEIRLTMHDGNVMCFNHDVGQWHTIKLPTGDTVGTRVTDADTWGSRHVVCDRQGNVWREKVPAESQATFYTDDTSLVMTPYRMSLTTGWMTFDGLQGLVRGWDLFILGQRADDTEVIVTIETDFSSVGSTTYTFPPDDTKPLMELRCHLKVQEFTSMRVRIVEGPGTANAGFLKLTSMRFEYGSYERGPKLQRSAFVR